MSCQSIRYILLAEGPEVRLTRHGGYHCHISQLPLFRPCSRIFRVAFGEFDLLFKPFSYLCCDKYISKDICGHLVSPHVGHPPQRARIARAESVHPAGSTSHEHCVRMGFHIDK